MTAKGDGRSEGIIKNERQNFLALKTRGMCIKKEGVHKQMTQICSLTSAANQNSRSDHC